MSGPFDYFVSRARDQLRKFVRQGWRSDLVLAPAQNQRRRADRSSAVRLVCQPHCLGTDTEGGGINPRHCFDNLASHGRIGGLGKKRMNSSLGKGAHISLAAMERL